MSGGSGGQNGAWAFLIITGKDAIDYFIRAAVYLWVIYSVPCAIVAALLWYKPKRPSKLN